MQLYGHGIRRRVAPMLGGDRDRLRLAWSLMFSLPGTPVLLYGDEIGMGENLAIEDRYAVRVPMQWSAEPHGGFSTADADDARAAAGRGRVRPGSGQRRRPAPRPRLAADWMERADPPPRERPSSAGAACTLVETADAVALRASLRLAGQHRGRRAQPRRRARPRRRWSSATTSSALDDLLELREHKVGEGGTLGGRARAPTGTSGCACGARGERAPASRAVASTTPSPPRSRAGGGRRARGRGRVLRGRRAPSGRSRRARRRAAKFSATT